MVPRTRFVDLRVRKIKELSGDIRLGNQIDGDGEDTPRAKALQARAQD